MLPQLAVRTFPSQVFWVLAGFACVYLFMQYFAVPRLRQALKTREQYLQTMQEKTEYLVFETEQLERAAQAKLDGVKAETTARETQLIAELETYHAERQEALRREFEATMQKELAQLKRSSETVFEEIASNCSAIVDEAVAIVDGKGT